MVHDGNAMSEFRYVTEWNNWIDAPMGEGRWLTESEASGFWESRDVGFEVVPGTVTDGTPSPWVLHVFTRDRSIRASFYLPGRPSADGGLFKTSIVDYRYADADQSVPDARPTAIITATFAEDGTGSLIMRDVVARDQTVSQYTDVPVLDHHVAMPEFGAWTPLTDPKLGERAATVR